MFNNLRTKTDPESERYLWEMIALTEKHSHFGFNFDDLTFFVHEHRGKLHTHDCKKFHEGSVRVSGKRVRDSMGQGNSCRSCGDALTLTIKAKKAQPWPTPLLAPAYLFNLMPGALNIYEAEQRFKLPSDALSASQAHQILGDIITNRSQLKNLVELFNGKVDKLTLKSEVPRLEKLLKDSIRTVKFQDELERSLVQASLTRDPSSSLVNQSGFMAVYRDEASSKSPEVKLSLTAWGTENGNISVIPLAVYSYLEAIDGFYNYDPRLLFKIPQRPKDEHLEFMNVVFNPHDKEALSLGEIYEMAKNI